MDEIKKKQLDVTTLVEECLISDTRCRDNDLWLILKIWQKKQGIKLYIPYSMIDKMIKPESITRARRKIQESNKHLWPTKPEVRDRRRTRQRAFRSLYGARK
jgi:hypothetical protein